MNQDYILSLTLRNLLYDGILRHYLRRECTTVAYVEDFDLIVKNIKEDNT